MTRHIALRPAPARESGLLPAAGGGGRPRRAPSRESGVAWILRAGVFACFVGHGVFGLLGKPAWLAYFDALGIGPGAAAWLMPLVGALDIAVGCAALLAPTRVLRPVLVWATFWGLATALLRPLAGEPVWEALERAGNYGVPLALLLLVARRRSGLADVARGPSSLPDVARVLQATTALLLLGHGALALAAKPLLVGHAAVLGLPAATVPVVGAAEVGLALAVAAFPAPGLLLGALAWKLSSELLFPLSGAPVWEFVERGGSYAAPLALALLLTRGTATAPLWRQRAAARAATTLASLVLAGALAAPASGQEAARARWAEVTREVASDELLAALAPELKAGTLTLLCRHAITDHGASDRGRAREQQRNLDAAGREQSLRMGRNMAGAGVPIGDVRASPMFRTMDTAELAFGRVEAETRLRGSDQRAALQGLLEEVPGGGNRVLVSHQGTIRGVAPIGRSPLEEGDCLVIRPLGAGAGFEVLARMGADDWARLP